MSTGHEPLLTMRKHLKLLACLGQLLCSQLTKLYPRLRLQNRVHTYPRFHHWMVIFCKIRPHNKKPTSIRYSPDKIEAWCEASIPSKPIVPLTLISNLATTILLLSISITTVSYTHLDVYKRQVILYFS